MAVKSLVLFAIIGALLVNGYPFSGKRKCSPMQWESDLFGKTAGVVQGKTFVYSTTAKFSADYKLGKQSALQKVYSDGQLIAAVRQIVTAVSAQTWLSIQVLNKG